MRYGSVCSGIEAATVAWHPLGWEPAFFSEIEAFPRAVLQHHYDTPVHGDFTTIGANDYGPIQLLVGGTPCQSFSVAGLRKGMDDERGNLALEYLKLAQRKRPTWLVWENVPGVLSSNGGRDFGAFLGGLGELGYGFAYRVLDAQYFGVAQRRRRVFVVGYLGDWRPPAAVLFERHSLQGHPAPRREAGKAIAESVISRDLTSSHTATGRLDPNETTFIPIAFGWQNSASQGDSVSDSVTPTLDKSKVPAIAFKPGSSADARSIGAQEEVACTLEAGGGGNNRQAVMTQYGTELAGSLTARHDSSPCHDRGQNMVAFTQNQRDELRTVEVPGALSAQPGMKQQTYLATCIQTANTGANGKNYADEVSYTLDRAQPHAVASQMQVRRLTPVECERLQGFPDNYTRIPYRGKEPDNCPDGPRYKALGNSMAVPVMHWIGQRIDMVNELLHEHYGDERKERQAEVMK